MPKQCSHIPTTERRMIEPSKLHGRQFFLNVRAPKLIELIFVLRKKKKRRNEMNFCPITFCTMSACAFPNAKCEENLGFSFNFNFTFLLLDAQCKNLCELRMCTRQSKWNNAERNETKQNKFCQSASNFQRRPIHIDVVM